MSDSISRIQTLQRLSLALADHIRQLVDASDEVGNAGERAEAFRLQALISARLDGLLFAAARGAETPEQAEQNLDDVLGTLEERIQSIQGHPGFASQQISQEVFKDVELIMTVLGPEHVLPPLPPLPSSLER